MAFVSPLNIPHRSPWSRKNLSNTSTTTTTTTTIATTQTSNSLRAVLDSAASSPTVAASSSSTLTNPQKARPPLATGPDTSLAEQDPELYDLLEREKSRQYKCLELIASENFASRAVLETLGSVLTNKYSEGYPGARYYGGNEYIDRIENLCRKRALEAFGLSEEEWGVNVQPYSGSPANFAAYTAVLKPHDRIMGLDLPSGGHLTHGFYTQKKKVSATSIYFESLPYKVDETTGIIDYDKLEEQANLYKPKMIIAGGSAYPREWDYKRFRSIADTSGAYLLVDMAHISGLVASGIADSPFEHADIVTSTTHKSLRGPRSGLIFYRKKPLAMAAEGLDTDLESAVNTAIFPSLQGGPHNHQIGALAVQLKQVNTAEFRQYTQQVVANAKAMAKRLKSHGYKLATDGTDNHLILWDLRPEGFTGSKAQLLYDECAITLNKNAVHGDRSAMTPGGVRIGAPALTTRGFKEKDFEQVADYLHRGLQIGIEIQLTTGKKLKDFEAGMKNNKKIADLKREVEEFASNFDMPGFKISEMKYP